MFIKIKILILKINKVNYFFCLINLTIKSCKKKLKKNLFCQLSSTSPSVSCIVKGGARLLLLQV